MATTKDTMSARLARIETKLESIPNIETKLDTVIASQATLKTELEVHKVKSGFYGAFMGALVSFVYRYFGVGGPNG